MEHVKTRRELVEQYPFLRPLVSSAGTLSGGIANQRLEEFTKSAWKGGSTIPDVGPEELGAIFRRIFFQLDWDPEGLSRFVKGWEIAEFYMNCPKT